MVAKCRGLGATLVNPAPIMLLLSEYKKVF
jgi:hypothetical protein